MSENQHRTGSAGGARRGGPGGGPGGAIGRPVEKAKDFKGTLRRLTGYLKPQSWKLAFVLVFTLFSTAFTVLAPRISGNAINQMTDGFIAKRIVSEVSKAQDSVGPALTAQLKQIDSGRAQAEEQAKSAARAALEKQGASEAQIAAAEQQAAAAADKAFSEKLAQTVSPEQLDAMRELAKLPRVSDVSGAEEKAKAVGQFVSLTKKMPQSGQSGQSFQISEEDLQKYLGDIRETGGAIPFGAIAKTLLFLLGIYLLSSLFSFLTQYMMSGVAQLTVYSLRKDLNDKLSRLPLKYYDGHTSGDILSRMTNDIDTISGTLQQSLTQLIQSVCQILGYVIMMLLYSPILTLIVLCTLPLYIGVTMLIASHSQKYYKAQQKHLGNLSGHTEEMFTGHIIVKAFGREQESIETFEQINDDLYAAGWKAQFMSGVMYPLMNFVSNIGYVLISVVGGIFVTKSMLNIGDITAFIQYSRSFSMPIIQTANIANIIQSTLACAERVFEVLDEEEDIPDAADAVKMEDPQGNIRFDHVKFGYSESAPLMEDMNLDFKRGETVAIVGPTGAGKTTLVNLLMRFYEINGGAITFDGVDIRNIARGNLRTMFGMVLQDTWLFNGTIEENIAYGKENATHEQIVAAAKAAHADHFVRSLPDGYQTVLNEEASNISQGQKQLLTIARAILADPAVLILDEATSSVDTRTEVLIQKAMSVLMRGRTNFVIAHRLSTIRDAHLILVMNHGTIVEAGNHRELMAKNGFYADLYNSQFAGANL
ncbi:ABC transporter ATP-binding protein [Caproiciproducens sp. NJN-50]|uniref:ABC transporter ATP-binding protein n=1 Tax=Caproiciproducens sp. NJN-50 TaxID=2507162 RepID=UPI000FFE2825|nr:ABC transporter ATP-binding protein [Caproiciproducens sp. NJN-50]QAT49044.1 ABC transporter ATP-binding protein [Caproiciproducens sp. NJN-50]